MFCLGCGSDLTGRQSDRRNIVSIDVITSLWKKLISDASGAGDSPFSPDTMLTKHQCMCRSCFSAYRRYNDLKNEITDNIKHVLESLPQFEIPSKKCRSHPDTPANPPMASSLHSSGSPDVGVCCTISVLRFAW